MPIVWPLKSNALALEVLARKHRSVHTAYKELKNSRELIFPIYVSPSGLVNFEFSYFLYETWLYRGKLKSEKTISTYAECLSCWFDYVAASGVDWCVCRERDIAGYRNWMCGTDVSDHSRKKLSGRTINLRIAVVAEFYKYYRARNSRTDCEKNIAETSSYKGLSVRVNKRRPKIIPDGKINIFKDSMSEVHWLIFLWCLCTGLRLGSVLRLTVSDVREVINSGGGFLKVIVKGGKSLDIYVPRKVIGDTERYIRVGRAIREGGAKEDSLFLNLRGSPVTRHGYYKAFKIAAQKAGCDCTPHSTRSTYASKLMEVLPAVCKEKGLDSIKVVQALLGHVSVETTKDYVDRIMIFSTSVLAAIDESTDEI